MHTANFVKENRNSLLALAILMVVLFYPMIVLHELGHFIVINNVIGCENVWVEINPFTQVHATHHEGCFDSHPDNPFWIINKMIGLPFGLIIPLFVYLASKRFRLLRISSLWLFVISVALGFNDWCIDLVLLTGSGIWASLFLAMFLYVVVYATFWTIIILDKKTRERLQSKFNVVFKV